MLQKLINEYRKYTNEEILEFSKTVEQKISVKSICGQDASDPDVRMLIRCLLCIRVLLERTTKTKDC